MKKFVNNTIIFFITTILILLGFYTYWFSEPETKVKITKKNIIIGDSNTRWSMDDNILSSYANYSTGGEIYLFAYRKLKILNKNNKIDTLLLSFNPHNIVNNMWWNDKDGTPIDNRMSGFYKDFSTEEHWDLFRKTPISYSKSIMKIGKSKLDNLFTFSYKKGNEIQKFGSYIPSLENETQNKPKYYPYKKPIIETMEIKYLSKIIEECRMNNIHIILIQPPKNYLRKDYKNYNHKEFYQIYQQYFSNIDFLDFAQLKLPPHAYWDMNHTDIVGAEYFSNFIQKQGIKKLLNSNFNRKNNSLSH